MHNPQTDRQTDRQLLYNIYGEDTIKFIYHKITIILPYFFFAWFVAFVIKSFIFHYSTTVICYNLLHSVWELLFLRMSGIYHVQSIGHTWFISAMLIAMFVIYPLNKALKGTFQLIITPLITIIGYGYMSHNYQTVNVAYVWNGICFMALIRAFLAMSLGCACYTIVGHFNKIKLNDKGKTILTIIECLLWLFVLLYIFLLYERNSDFIIILLITIALIISFSDQSYLNKIINSSIFTLLGKLSLTIYLNHFIVTKIANVMPMELTNMQRIIIYIVGSTAMGIIGLIGGEWLQNTFNAIVQKLKKQLIQP